ncbi:MAG: gentisate 1,2-dioxygenase [Planctomycetota bacterium]|jgi:gentisate 1,2-dioxygenase
MTAKLNANWAEGTEYFEYSSAADPSLAPVQISVFPASLHQVMETKAIPLDQSDTLGIPYPCTSPNLLASYLHINGRESISISANATSQVLFCIRGSGRLRTKSGEVEWSQGDFLAFPGSWEVMLEADEDTAFYWVHDGPLLAYLGATATSERFRPLYFSAARLAEQLEKVWRENEGKQRNRNGILLANRDCPTTQTVTHTMWSLYNLLPKGTRQKAHRHNSVALDLCVAAGPDTYTMIGKRIDADGHIIDPVRADWAPGAAFVTPPGWWHSHHNDSDQDAIVLPIQDAALYTHLQTLDIRFSKGH